jgi:hypothetical protein
VIKRELNIKPIDECRCDERLKTKGEESTRHWIPRGTGTPTDKDEVNRREVYEEQRKRTLRYSTIFDEL